MPVRNAVFFYSWAKACPSARDVTLGCVKRPLPSTEHPPPHHKLRPRTGVTSICNRVLDQCFPRGKGDSLSLQKSKGWCRFSSLCLFPCEKVAAVLFRSLQMSHSDTDADNINEASLSRPDWTKQQIGEWFLRAAVEPLPQVAIGVVTFRAARWKNARCSI